MKEIYRVALVLGSGGILGGAFHAGVLKALYDAWQIDARDVDLIVGTSAGTITGALAAAGLHPNDIFRREIGGELSPSGQRLMRQARARRGPRQRQPKVSTGRPMAPEVLIDALLRPCSIMPGSVMAAMLPRGTVSTSPVASLVEGLLGQIWPEKPELEICAVDAGRARRVVFGRPGRWSPNDATSPNASPAEAVAASCAVPGVFEPVSIRGREYHDGGVHSADNLDVIGGRSFDLVVVSSPMSSAQPFTEPNPWGMARATTRAQTSFERQLLPGCPRVVVVRPTQEDLEAMGHNFLDTRRRATVAHQALASARRQFERAGMPENARRE